MGFVMENKLNIEEIKQLLAMNYYLLSKERRSYDQFRLLTHRAILKDCLIEQLELALEYYKHSELKKVG